MVVAVEMNRWHCLAGVLERTLEKVRMGAMACDMFIRAVVLFVVVDNQSGFSNVDFQNSDADRMTNDRRGDLEG